MRFTVGDPFTTNSSLWESRSDGGDLHPLLPEQSVPGVLWQLDPGRTVFRISKYSLWDFQHLGIARAFLAVVKDSSRPCAAHGRAVELRRSCSQSGWQKTICAWFPTSRGTREIRRKDRRISPLPLGLIGGRCAFCWRWKMRGL